MAKHNFSFKVRQATQVAASVAAEVENTTRFGGEGARKYGFVPSCLSISAPETKNEIVFRYTGGTVVRVFLFDMDTLTEYWRTPHVESWVVYQVSIKYYRLDPRTYCKVGDGKLEETWDADRLAELREQRPFETRVVPIDDITGYVGIFIDYVSCDGFVENLPAHNTQGHYTIAETVSYRILVEGDLEQAMREAKVRLRELLAEQEL